MQADIRNSVITGSEAGLHVNPTSVASQLTVDNCQIVNNNIGVRSDGLTNGSDLRLVNSTVTRNTYSLEALAPGRIVTRVDGNGVKTNTVEANSNPPNPSTVPTFLAK